jgi:hypothetical protein
LLNNMNFNKKSKPKNHKSSFENLTAAALILPGLLQTAAFAAERDEVDFQYGHYQEGNRSISGSFLDNLTGFYSTMGIKPDLKPIEVDSIHGSGKFSLTDRVKFAFNYLQDTWGGATPISSAPTVFGENMPRYASDGTTVIGPSPLLLPGQGAIDGQGHPILLTGFNSIGEGIYQANNQVTNVLVSASPEVRNQGDLKLSYEWNEAALNVGGGISSERDYESRFGNIGGLWNFNQKRTTLNLGLSYTNSDTHAVLAHDSSAYVVNDAYKANGQLKTDFDRSNAQVLSGNRQDWGTSFGLSQIINKDAVLSANVSYTSSSGYLANPYKAVSVLFIDPANQTFNPPNVFIGEINALIEQRPNDRNQVNLGGRYVQFINPLDAALHFDYHFSTDDWGIQSHTFDADWVQPVGNNWTVTPRVRYYSQDAANFYAPWLISQQAFSYKYDVDFNRIGLPYDPGKLPANFSSDARLAAFGALSGGVIISKKFAKGLSLETGFEYYTHQGSLQMGGGSDNNFNNFDSWNVNAALKLNLDRLSLRRSADNDHAGHDHQHGVHAPSGVMFDHMLSTAGDMMVGYRYVYGSQSGDTLHGSSSVSDPTLAANGCSPNPCYLKPGSMSMNMHMLDLMYAPTDWLTLMLMPQFVSMSMTMNDLYQEYDPNTHPMMGDMLSHHIQSGHQTGGIGDLGMYALFKLYDNGVHHLHITTGLSAPTGNANLQLNRNHKIDGGYIDYGMQLGSGTWDFKPSLTYTGQWQQLSWGAQSSGTVRMENRNESGYALGDQFQSTAWGSFHFTHWLSASVRGLFTSQGAVKNQYNGLVNQYGPMDYTANYGGNYWDVGFGLSATVPSGDLAGNRISVEWLQPVQDNVNGYQLERDGNLAATWSLAF